MTGWMTDVRYAVRMLLKHPAVSTLAVGALALGIGLTGVTFSIVYGALLRGLPFENGDRIMAVQRVIPSVGAEEMPVPVHDWLDWRAQQSSFEHLAAFYSGTVNITWNAEPVRYSGAFVSANLFPALRVEPVLGRTFTQEEEQADAPATVVLSHHLWAERFDRDPSVLGRVVRVNGEQAEIIGVMPEGFLFPVRQDVWVPLRMDALRLPRGTGVGLQVLGPLAPGVDVDQAMVEFAGIAARLGAEHPDTNDGVVPVVRPFVDVYIGDEAAPFLWTMLVAVLLVLLIACVNVANLLLARAARRTREVGVRTALGAGRRRVVGQMVLEALALATVAAVLGAGIAWGGITLFERAIASTDPPYFLVFDLDGPVLACIACVTVLAAVVGGGVPALRASNMDINEVLKDESRGSSSLRVGRLSRALVVGEVAMSVGLLVVAGLMTRSITTLRNYDYGVDTDGLFTTRLGLFEADFPDVESRRAFYAELERRVRELAGVRAAAIGTLLPGLGAGQTWIEIEGRTYADRSDRPLARNGQVGTGYSSALGVELLEGRAFDERDDATGARVAIVNRSFAAAHFPGESPVGRRFRAEEDDGGAEWLTVVGVVPDLVMQGAGTGLGDPAGYYVPIQQSDARFVSILARARGEPLSLTEGVRAAVASVHADTPIYYTAVLTDRIVEQTWFFRIFGALFMVFGAAALFLASVGLYGVMSFTVAQRTPEMGIRMALGASSNQVLRLVLRQGMTQVALGTLVGLGLATLLARSLQLLLFHVSPSDPLVFASIVLVLALTGFVASFVPALRAVRADPAAALRYD